MRKRKRILKIVVDFFFFQDETGGLRKEVVTTGTVAHRYGVHRCSVFGPLLRLRCRE